MTALKKKIGQMMMVGLNGEELSHEEKRLLREYSFGGFLLFKHNLREPEQILSLCRSIWENAPVPPFIAIDQEGGKVHRLPPPFTHFPSAALLGRTGNSALAYRVGLATARELLAVGLNLNFAPVLDVHSNPGNPVIGDRSLGPDPQEVTRLGWAIIQGLRDGGIIPCGKHFPGHGDTRADSHLELPVVKKGKSALRATELPPFIHACHNQVESLMTAHVLYPALDPARPATLSKPILTQLLRNELGYQGVVFGDDLEMKAISKNYPVEEAAQFSVLAGVDVLLFCHETGNSVSAFEFLHQRAEKNAKMKTRIEESYQRIRKLKQRCLTSLAGIHEEGLKNSVRLPRHQRIVEEIQRWKSETTVVW